MDWSQSLHTGIWVLTYSSCPLPTTMACGNETAPTFPKPLKDLSTTLLGSETQLCVVMCTLKCRLATVLDQLLDTLESSSLDSGAGIMDLFRALDVLYQH